MKFLNKRIHKKGELLPFFNGLTPEAAAFLTAAGITDPTITNAINRLVLNYKGQGNLNTSVDLWTDTDLILPLVGGNATAHRGNLKNAINAITFFGGLTHNANGITGNGTNGYGVLTIAPNSLLQNNNRVAGYVRTDNGAASFAGLIGATNSGFTNGLDIEINKSSATLATYNNTTFNTSALATRTGFFGVNRTVNTAFKELRNGNVLRTVTANSLAPIATTFAILANNNNGSLLNFSPESVAFYVAGKGLSDANLLLEYNIIQQFQTDLGRNV